MIYIWTLTILLFVSLDCVWVSLIHTCNNEILQSHKRRNTISEDVINWSKCKCWITLLVGVIWSHLSILKWTPLSCCYRTIFFTLSFILYTSSAITSQVFNNMFTKSLYFNPFGLITKARVRLLDVCLWKYRALFLLLKVCNTNNRFSNTF